MPQAISGILNINKPRDMTSLDAVRTVKRLTQAKRAGHAGTLDPLAQGVLPICLGHATRVMDYIVDARKEYQAVIELGKATDTYDGEGRVLSCGDYSQVSLEQVKEALSAFVGTFPQVPPLFSALRKDGKRLYNLARAGVQVERQPRDVTVFGLDLLEWKPPTLTLRLECGRGVYIRSLAHDLGMALGCGGFLKDLVRLRSGPFHLDGATSLGEMEKAFSQGTWQDLLYPVDYVLMGLRAAILGPDSERLLRQGRAVPSRAPFSPRSDWQTVGSFLFASPEIARAYSLQGELFAILKFDQLKKHWRPDKVF